MAIYAMTGGATGIGAAIRQRLTDEGHAVTVVDLKSADVEADLSTAAGRQAAVDGIRHACPDGLDGFIACAGLGSHVPDTALIVKVNYFGAVAVLEGVRDLLKTRGGSAVLISSNSASMDYPQDFIETLLTGDEAVAAQAAASVPGQVAYGGSKQAVTRWMRRNTRDWAADGIRLNAVAPGFTQTPMTDAVMDDPNYGPQIKKFLQSIPLGRPGQPEDMAAAVSFLLGPEAGFVCGSVLFVDGGHDAMLRPDSF